jgi:hypothetical protein
LITNNDRGAGHDPSIFTPGRCRALVCHLGS